MHLPKIRFHDLPRSVWQHLLERVQERHISLADLERLQSWVHSGPEAPDGDWYKDFGSFLVSRKKMIDRCEPMGVIIANVLRQLSASPRWPTLASMMRPPG